MPNIDIAGIDAHIGSQLIDVAPFREAAERLAGLIEEIRGLGIDMELVDIGGGLGIKYEDEDPPDPCEWADMIIPVLEKTGCRIIIQPGRSLMGNAGILLTRVDRRTRHAQEVVDLIREHYGRDVFRTEIRENVRLAESVSFGRSIYDYAPNSNGAADYQALTDEILRKERQSQ